MIDRSSGKTLSNAFVELKDQEEAHHAIVICNRKPLKGRLVHVSLSSQDELLNAIFPSWSGDFLNGMAVPADNDVAPTKLGHTFITRQEINSLLTICRNYKVSKRRWYCPNFKTS
jgi:RNA recognition motif-containing protein